SSTLLVGQSFTFNITNLSVNSGGAISSDGTSSSTVGLGGASQNGSGGGGHGGSGGKGAGSGATGGSSGSDLPSAPGNPGGRGGFIGIALSPSPNGGGALRINAAG